MISTISTYFKLFCSWVVALYVWLKDNYVTIIQSFRAFCKKHTPVSYENIAIFCCYLLVVGCAEWMLQRFVLKLSNSFFLDWMIAYRPDDGAAYNHIIITYIAGLVGILGAVFLWFILKTFPKLHSFVSSITERLWGYVFGAAIMLKIMCPFLVADICSSTIIILLSLRVLLEHFPNVDPARNLALSKEQNKGLFVVLMGVVALCIYIAANTWYPVRLINDYLEVPDKIAIPQYDLENAKQKPDNVLYMGRRQAMDCMIDIKGPFLRELMSNSEALHYDAKREDYKSRNGHDANDDEYDALQRRTTAKNKLKDNQVANILDTIDARGSKDTQQSLFAPRTRCPEIFTQRQSDIIRSPLTETGRWQAQAGRILYHHSYIYVPATHLLTHGLSTPIPYLYGLGNTFFHAMLMKDKPQTITTYFETYPIAQLAGILFIALALLYMTGNWMSVPVAMLLAIWPLSQLTYEALQLAPGFNPLRYAGLAVQFASIFFVCRGKSPLRVIVLILALVFSLVWNKEFAILGLVGQLFALMSPQLAIGKVMRIVTMAVTVCIGYLTLKWLGSLSTGFLETVQVGLFGIAVPPLDMGVFLDICQSVILACVLGAVISSQFTVSERIARLSLLPVFSLLMIKYLYNPSPVHMLFTLVFIYPMALAFLDWNNKSSILPKLLISKEQLNKLSKLVFLGIAAATLVAVVNYQTKATERDLNMFHPFKINTWAALGETFETPALAPAIVDRITALKEQIKPDDAVLFLSPFDHLMSFYTNPAHYCGHFEYLTNLVTTSDVRQVKNCVRQNPNVLLVYDDAIKAQCPSVINWQIFGAEQRKTLVRILYNMNTVKESCIAKHKLYGVFQEIMDSVSPDLVLVKKVGTLSFYRHAKSAN